MRRRSLAIPLSTLLPWPRRRGGRRLGMERACWTAAGIAITLTLLGPLYTAQASRVTTLPPPSGIQLTASPSSPQPVGTQITWTATATDSVPLVYRFSVSTNASGPYALVRDFSTRNSFVWTPYQEGTYYIAVTLKEGYTGTATVATGKAFTVTSRVSGTSAVVSQTANPLVALYSAPACSAGYIVVRYSQVGTQNWSYTNGQACRVGLSRNFLVAGMQANTTYQMQSIVVSGTQVTVSPASQFTTGVVPAAVILPSASVPISTPQANLAANIDFHLLGPSNSISDANPLATDLQGNLVWYANQTDLSQVWPLRVQQVGGAIGNAVFLVGNDGQQQNADNVLRQIDFAGDPLRETSIQALNPQLAAKGLEPIYGFHHDALMLPNGDIATLGFTQQVITTTPVEGDMVIVLNSSLQLVWAWDGFQHLDPNRGPTLGDTCGSALPLLCPGPGAYNPNTIDWTHSNGLDYSTTDKNLLLSVRNQDWIIKINYNNGSGDGSILWRMGPGGDFTLVPANPSDPFPWFSHQHDPNYISGNSIELWDNGNTRYTDAGCTAAGTPQCDSRGQAYVIDEQHMVVTQTVNLDTGTYSQALGTAQKLANGDFDFGSGFQMPPPPHGQEIEMTPSGTKTYVQQIGNIEYRGWRLVGMDGSINPTCPSCD